MPQQHLDIHQLGPRLQKPSRVGMPELMRRDLLVDACPPDEPPEIAPPCMGAGTLPPGSVANTNSSFPLSFSQSPDTWPKASGSGTRRSRLPLLQLHS
jgi:hypothetical protein